MAKKTMRDEIAELRQQIQELASSQTPGAAPQAATPEGAEPEQGAWHDELATKFEELFQSLEKDLNEVPTATGLAIFALGILVGRSLAA